MHKQDKPAAEAEQEPAEAVVRASRHKVPEQHKPVRRTTAKVKLRTSRDQAVITTVPAQTETPVRPEQAMVALCLADQHQTVAEAQRTVAEQHRTVAERHPTVAEQRQTVAEQCQMVVEQCRMVAEQQLLQAKKWIKRPFSGFPFSEVMCDG